LWAPVPADMGSHMKTTVDIATDLLRQAKGVAARERTTLRALLEEGLRWALGRRRRRDRFTLRDATVGGKGVQPGVDDTDWASLRDSSYGGRGS
jgi:hypothetical protein